MVPRQLMFWAHDGAANGLKSSAQKSVRMVFMGGVLRDFVAV
jgi:hypothetical protein